jgi:hypothetical protein
LVFFGRKFIARSVFRLSFCNYKHGNIEYDNILNVALAYYTVTYFCCRRTLVRIQVRRSEDGQALELHRRFLNQ